MTKPTPSASPEAPAPLIPDALWERVEPILIDKPSRTGRPALSSRQVLSGVLYVKLAEAPWNGLPSSLGFGSGSVCRRRLEEWKATGMWRQVSEAIEHALRDECAGVLLAEALLEWRWAVTEMLDRLREPRVAALHVACEDAAELLAAPHVRKSRSALARGPAGMHRKFFLYSDALDARVRICLAALEFEPHR